MPKLTQKRHEEILNLLQTRGTVSVSELTTLLDSSESTIRRDLVALDKMGKLTKVHGGATVNDKQFLQYEPNIEEKLNANVNEKRRIAKYAAAQLQDGDFIYLDAGTTTLLMIDYLVPKDVSFVTNGIVHARELSRRGFRTFILGGELKTATEAVVGTAASHNLEKYNFSKAFIGTNGVSVKHGFTTPDGDEAFLKAAAIDRSFVSYVLADSSKFGLVSTVTFAPLCSSAIVTDALPDPGYENSTVVKVVPEETVDE